MGGAGTQIRLRKGNHSSEDGLYGILSSYLLAPFYLMKKSAKIVFQASLREKFLFEAAKNF
jgi:hypothetical protein